jgi:glyoxylase-like metal-dependent hydrolase (beta-lactamase superfamily II)
MTIRLTRRHALAAAAALPAMPFLGAGAAFAAAPKQDIAPHTFKRFAVGEMEVTALLGGTRTVEDPQGTFGMNVGAEEFAAVSAAAFIPTDKSQFFFNPTLVNTGAELILFDTGLNGAAIIQVLADAGYTPDQVDVVVLTHSHGDHVGGMTAEDGTPTFPNARYITGRVEFDAIAGTGNEGFDAKVAPFADKMTFLEGGGAVTSGITAMEMFGHTPGHMGYMIDSGGRQLLLAADLANHYVWSLGYPDWEVRFDRDKAEAAASRRRVLGMLAAEKIAFLGYHMPFPGVGFVETRGEGGFRYVPESYQFML